MLRKGHHVKNVSFPHVSTEHYGALNTLPEQTLFGELRGGHITSNWQRAWVFKLDGIHGPSFLSHTPKKPPTFCFHCLFFYSCTRSPQWRPDLYSLAQLRVAHHKELQGVCEVFHHLNSVPFISLVGKAAKKSVFMPPEIGRKTEFNLFSLDTTLTVMRL